MSWKKLGILFTLFLLVLPITLGFATAEDTYAEKFVSAVSGVQTPSSLNIDWASVFNPDQATGQWFIRILLFLLVTLIVYSVSDALPFIEGKGFISFVISLIVAILATFFLSPQEINLAILSYKPLGIVLTAIIPFFAIAAVAKRSYNKGHFLLTKVLWIAFVIFLITRLFLATPTEIGNFGFWAYFTAILISLAMLLFEQKIYFMLYKSAASGDLNTVKKLTVARLEAKIAQTQEQMESLPEGETKDQLIQKERALQKDLARARSFKYTK